jgi:hypothetical protein
MKEGFKSFVEGSKKVFKTVFGLFMESDGKLSMTRIAIGAILCAYIRWGNQIVEATNVIPDLPYGLAGFLAVLYNFNKGGTISLGNKNGPTK